MSETEQFLAVDIGNNQIKVGLFLPEDRGGELPEPVWVRRLPTASLPFDTLAEGITSERLSWYVATVHRAAEGRLAEWVRQHRPQDHYRLLTHEQLPIEIRVDHPEQVGTDRLLAAVAVNRLRQPDRAAVVIDAGSAITVDLVAADGAFEGGVILPGFRMVARALAHGTDLLPLVEQFFDEQTPPVVGKSTVAAIRSGLFWGSVGAVRELVSRMSQPLAHEPQLFVGGGDAQRLADFLSSQARVVGELVLAGIALTR